MKISLTYNKCVLLLNSYSSRTYECLTNTTTQYIIRNQKFEIQLNKPIGSFKVRCRSPTIRAIRIHVKSLFAWCQHCFLISVLVFLQDKCDVCLCFVNCNSNDWTTYVILDIYGSLEVYNCTLVYDIFALSLVSDMLFCTCRSFRSMKWLTNIWCKQCWCSVN